MIPDFKPDVTASNLPTRTSNKPIAERLVYTVPEAGRLLGLGRNAAYDAAKRGDIPTIRMGRLLRVPKAPLHKLLGTDIPGSSAPDETHSSIEDGSKRGTA